MDYAALSAHTDAKGILQIVQQVAPASVMLVHGEPDKMAFMSDKIQRSLNIPCFMPANGEEVVVDSGKAHILPVSAQLLRQLPASLQELQQQGPVQWAGAGTAEQAPGSSGRGMCSVGEAAAGWLQQGDIGQLAGAAMRLAGLAPPGSTIGTSEGTSRAPVDQQQQQLLQVHGTAAAARAAQLAPWLELLAAAAQDVRQQRQQQQPQQLRQPDGSMTSSGLVHGSQQVPSSPAAAADIQSDVPGSLWHGASGVGPGALQSCLVSVAQDLQQQAWLEQQAVLVDGVLLVHHPPAAAEGQPVQPAASMEQVPQQQQQQRIQLELLPAEAAAARLQMQQHHIKLSCRLQLPVQQAQDQQGQAAAPPEQQHTSGYAEQGSFQNNLNTASFIAAVLKSGLPTPLAQLVEVGMIQLSIRSIKFEHEAEASGKSCWKCSWSLADDALAQQCVALVKQHL